MSPDRSPGVPELLDAIRQRIEQSGPIPFAEFMELALYHPEHGYYTSDRERIGTGGDFFTASDVGTLFGECLSHQIVELDDLLGRPTRFSCVEIGAGRGLMARDVLRSLGRDHPDLADRTEYVAVDRSPAMRRRASAEGVVTAAELGAVGGDRVGCVLAVELFDALPVHRVRRREGRMWEVRVDVGAEGSLVEREVPASAQLRDEADRRRAAPADGYEAEICLELAPTMEALAGAVGRGFLIVVDYGHDREELYGPSHARGTLLAYHRHTTNEDYLARVGEQDLTAHVDLTELVRAARASGWELTGRTTQDRFLIANGILRHFEQSDDRDRLDPERARTRLRAMQLIHPHAMGRAFHVLVFHRPVGPPPRLRGLVDPFER